MIEFNSVMELVNIAGDSGCRISDVVMKAQAEQNHIAQDEMLEKMKMRLDVMKNSALEGFKTVKSLSGLSGGMAYRFINGHPHILTGVSRRAAGIALAVSEHNACMGLTVACPTAGSCGILPAVILALGEENNLPDIELTQALFNSAGIGMVISNRAFLSGAQGGCQAECGSAAGMAASAAVELMGGTPKMCADACAFSLKFTMGLVCDPVAGLVEVPCVKRNASCAVTALTAAELALSGISSAIPVDEVIDALKEVGLLMPVSLKETSLAGLASTKTAKAIEAALKSESFTGKRVNN